MKNFYCKWKERENGSSREKPEKGRCFMWNAFPTPYSNVNWIHFWAGGTT